MNITVTSQSKEQCQNLTVGSKGFQSSVLHIKDPSLLKDGIYCFLATL